MHMSFKSHVDKSSHFLIQIAEITAITEISPAQSDWSLGGLSHEYEVNEASKKKHLSCFIFLSKIGFLSGIGDANIASES